MNINNEGGRGESVLNVFKSLEVQDKLKCDEQPKERQNLPHGFFEISLRGNEVES